MKRYNQLLQSHLRARCDKCLLLCNSVTYLRHIITSMEIEEDEDKIAGIHQLEFQQCNK